MKKAANFMLFRYVTATPSCSSPRSISVARGTQQICAIHARFPLFTGRIDDMLNVSGHLMSTAQVESVLVEHPWIAEAAVVGKKHDIKGECLYCFVTVKDGASYSAALEQELCKSIRQKIGALATPDFIQVRSLKLLRIFVFSWIICHSLLCTMALKTPQWWWSCVAKWKCLKTV